MASLRRSSLRLLFVSVGRRQSGLAPNYAEDRPHPGMRGTNFLCCSVETSPVSGLSEIIHLCLRITLASRGAGTNMYGRVYLLRCVMHRGSHRSMSTNYIPRPVGRVSEPAAGSRTPSCLANSYINSDRVVKCYLPSYLPTYWAHFLMDIRVSV
jgi:hypothetical protein